MATRLEDEFDSSRINAPDAAYPAGSLKDETTPGVSDDGTPLASRVGNDWQGFSQSVLNKAGIVANGQPDSVSNPQILQAIEKMYNDGDSQLSGGNIWPLNSQDSAQDGDVLNNNLVISDATSYYTIYETVGNIETAVSVSGVVSGLNFSTLDVTVGGVPYKLRKIDVADNTRYQNQNLDFRHESINSHKNSYSTKLSSRFDRLRNRCAVGRSYIYDNPDFSGVISGYIWSMGVNMNGNRTAEWIMGEDADGFYRMIHGYVGNIRESTIFQDATNLSDTPTVVGSNGYFLANTQTGATFEIPFTGVGIIFRCNVDDRGGMWSVSVDGGTPQLISTNSDNPSTPSSGSQYDVRVGIGLENAPHTAVFTFIGDDPSYPPSDGNARGWFKTTSGGGTTETANVLTGEEMGLAIANSELVVTNILEFAINCTPAGSGFARDWVPSHSQVPGAVQINKRTIFIDNQIVSDDLSEIGSEREIGEFTMIQEYTAFNTNDTLKTTPMWDGVLITKFDKINGLTNDHQFKLLTSVEFGNGYQAQVTGRRTSGLDSVRYDNSFEIDISGAAPPSTVSHRPGIYNSVSYEGTNGVAMKTNSFQATAALESGASEWLSLTNERADGFVKSYTQAFSFETVSAGEEFTSNHSIWLAVSI